MDTIPPAPEAERAPTAPSEPSLTPRHRRRWPWVVVIIAGALAIALSAAVLVERGRSDAQATSASPPPTTPPPPAPKHLTATAASFQVALRWRPSGAEIADQQYGIYRDGEYVGTAMNGDLRYVDKTALPSQRYRYAVRAVAPNSFGDPAVVVVRTHTAPKSVARLEGVFDMKFHITSSYGVHGFGNKTEGFRYTPNCDKGACTTHVVDIHTRAFATDLHRSGGTYKSSFAMHGYIYCNSNRDDTSVSITLHVTKAKVFRDAWRVTEVAGTMTVSVSSQLGCQPGGITYSVHGSLPAA